MRTVRLASKEFSQTGQVRVSVWASRAAVRHSPEQNRRFGLMVVVTRRAVLAPAGQGIDPGPGLALGQVRSNSPLLVSSSRDTGVHSLAKAVGAVLVVAEPVGRAVDADHGGPVQEPVQHRRGDGGVPER